MRLVAREPTDLHEAAREAIEVVEPEIRQMTLSLEVALDADRHRMDGDTVRLRQRPERELQREPEIA